MMTAIRVAALLALATGGMLLMMAEPTRENGAWTAVLWMSKGGAGVLLCAAGWLYGRWKNTDSALGAWDEWITRNCD